MSAHPNIVIIIADDLRADALENPLVRTPSRMANFTGLYPQVNGHRSLYQLLRPHERSI
jgi:arylsulfatase A-like enzyme